MRWSPPPRSPGARRPKIISRGAVERMRAGSVVVDIAAEQGGNCELTRAGEVVEHQGVKIIGAVNLPADLAYNASEMYARNLLQFPQAGPRQGRAGDRLDRRGVRAVLPGQRRGDQARTDQARRWRLRHDRDSGALHLHARSLHRLRGHRQGAGDPAHAADVRARTSCTASCWWAPWWRWAAPIPRWRRSSAFIGVLLAAGNAVGGYVVTERMLEMFKSSGNRAGKGTH